MNLKFLKISSVVTAFFLLAACNEAPFSAERENGKNKYGEFHKSALTFDVRQEDGIVVQTRSKAVNIDDFQLTFYCDGEVVRTASYREIPEVMTLEQGVYSITAEYGTDIEAAYDHPYFKGESAEFEVKAQEITSSIEPIVCHLQNVKVSVVFEPELMDVAGDESYIEVKVKNGKGLKFYKTSDLTKQNVSSNPETDPTDYSVGYFRINDETTLVATFNGSLYGSEVQNDTKSLADISGGNHYKMTFKLHPNGENNHGDANGGISIDGSVEYENMETNVVIKEELYDDNERPKEEGQGGEEPGPGPDDPIDNPVTGAGPEITAQAPIDLEAVNDVEDGLACVLNIHSESGVTGFTVKIDSPKLTDEVLTGVKLAAEFDLVSGKTAAGKDVLEGLESLGLPVGDDVRGQKDIEFNITQFLSLLGIYGAAEHKFILTVTDVSGTTQKTLILRTL